MTNFNYIVKQSLNPDCEIGHYFIVFYNDPEGTIGVKKTIEAVELSIIKYIILDVPYDYDCNSGIYTHSEGKVFFDSQLSVIKTIPLSDKYEICRFGFSWNGRTTKFFVRSIEEPNKIIEIPYAKDLSIEKMLKSLSEQ